MQENYYNSPSKANPAQGKRLKIAHLTVLMFSGIILSGTVLLMLPAAQKQPVVFIDALFTATSATCLTGLLTINVAESFTTFGQVVIMALIELGAIGIITVSTGFALMLGKSISITQSSMIHDTFTASNTIDVRKLLKSVLVFLFTFELAGALAFAILWAPEQGIRNALFHGVFLSISAFCNAGISSFTDGLESYMEDIPTMTVFVILIVAGGIGFLTIAETHDKVKTLLANIGSTARSRVIWSFQARIVFFVTAVSLLVGSALVFVMEYGGAHKGMPVATQIVSSLFHIASSRTAGFATIDIAAYGAPTVYIFMILMFIGGAPVSTAGGIKVTTFALLGGMAMSRFKGVSNVQLLNRSVPEEVISRAISIVFIAITVLVVAMFILLMTESAHVATKDADSSFLPILFEAVSAFGTVGLSLGITPKLTVGGKIVIMLLMLMGRLGPLTIAMAVAGEKGRSSYRYAEETMMVG